MAPKKKIYKTKKKNVKKTALPKKSPKSVNKLTKPIFKKQIKELPKVEKNPPVEEQFSDSDNGENMLEMVEEDDLNFLKNAISNREYNIFNKIRLTGNGENRKRRKRKLDEEDNDGDDLENNYEENREVEDDDDNNKKKVKSLLPIKTKDKIIPQTMVIDKAEESEDDYENEEQEPAENDEQESEAQDGEENGYEFVEDNELDLSNPLTTADLLIKRNKILQEKKLLIGTLSAGLLETPEEKLFNFKKLLELLEDNTPEIYISLKKIVIISLLEVFKDLLPSYKISPQDNPGVKLKKETSKLQKYEKGLLLYYKKYLQKLENYVSVLFKKQGDTRQWTMSQIKLGELSLQTMCDLLIAQPYFNYSENIVQAVVPFLNNRNTTVRQIVGNSCKIIFKEDKKEQITLKILQVLNQHLKKHEHNVHIEMLEILLSLKIKDVNLDQEKTQDLKEKKLQSHKQNVLQLSKNERKRKKRLIQLEQELLETKAEESKQSKMKYLTEITKIMFGIYFRVLKSSTNTKILGVCLEGLAKFSHCINVEYFVDIVNVLDNLLKEDWLGYRERLNCILTVFVILSGVGEALNIDPTRFYVALYQALLATHAAKTYKNFDVVLQTLNHALIKRRKKITNKRIIGFVKRISTLSLQLAHNGTLSCLAIIKSMLQLNKSVDILLDVDTSVGDGRYMPELDDAEYSNAASTSLFEIVPLSNHYHPIVSKYAKSVANVNATTSSSLPPEYAKCSPEDLFKMFDTTQMAFNPPVPIPKKVTSKIKTQKRIKFADEQFKSHCFDLLKKPIKSKSFYMEL